MFRDKAGARPVRALTSGHLDARRGLPAVRGSVRYWLCSSARCARACHARFSFCQGFARHYDPAWHTLGSVAVQVTCDRLTTDDTDEKMMAQMKNAAMDDVHPHLICAIIFAHRCHLWSGYIWDMPIEITKQEGTGSTGTSRSPFPLKL